MNGIATVVVAWNGGRIRLVSPPRALTTGLERGVVFGIAHEEAQQRQTLKKALSLLEQDAPLKIVSSKK